MRNNRYILILIPAFIACLTGVHQDSESIASGNFRLQHVNEYDLPDDLVANDYIFSVNDWNRDIALYSYGNKTIYLIKTDGYEVGKELVTRIIEGFHFENPTDLKFDTQGNLWVADPVRNDISIWSPSFELKSIQVNHDRTASKVSLSRDFTAIAFSEYYKELGFLIIKSRNSNKIHEVGRLPQEMKISSIFLDGTLVSDSSSVFFGNLNSGLITCYDSSGKLVYTIPTVQHVPLADIDQDSITVEMPDNIQMDISFSKISASSDNAIVDMDVSSSYLIVLFAGNSKSVGEFIDIYLKSNGHYLGSIILSDFTTEYFTGLEVVGNDLFFQSTTYQGSRKIQEFRLYAN